MYKVRYKIVSFIFAYLFMLCSTFTAYGDISIYFLDVGQGDATIIVCDGEAMIIDGGDRVYSRFIYSYLTNTLNLDHLKYVISTHPHADHAGGLAAALNVGAVEAVFSPVTYYDDPGFGALRKQMMVHNMPFTMPLPGNTMQLGQAEVIFLAPDRLTANMNDNSIIVKIAYGATSFLFLADAEQEEEQALLASGLDITADVLKVGHHGSDTSTSDTFLSAVNPQCAVISCGKNNTYGHPAQSVLFKLSQIGATVYRTDQNGTILCRSDGTTLTWKTEKDSHTFVSYAAETIAHDRAEQADFEHGYIGNKSSHKLHYPDCVGVMNMKEENKVVFTSREDAISLGYSSCQICNP